MSRGRPAKWQRGPDGKYLRDRNGDLIPLDSTPRSPAEPVPERRETPAAEKSGRIEREFKSLADFLHVAGDGECVNPVNASYLKQVLEHGDSDGDWYGLQPGASFADVMATVLSGWSDGATRLFDASNEVKKPSMESLTRKTEYMDQGESICLDRLYAGEFEKMWRGFKPNRADKAGRIVRINCNVAISSSVTPETAFWTGASALVLADALQNAGYAVEIDLIAGAVNKEREIVGKIRLKDADQPLSISGLASTMCLAGFYRGPVLSWFVKNYQLESTYGLGHPLPKENPGGGIFMGHGTVKGREDCIRWVNEKLAEFA